MRVGCERAGFCGAFLRDSDTGAVTPTGTLTPDGAYPSRHSRLGHRHFTPDGRSISTKAFEHIGADSRNNKNNNNI